MLDEDAWWNRSPSPTFWKVVSAMLALSFGIDGIVSMRQGKGFGLSNAAIVLITIVFFAIDALRSRSKHNRV